MAGDPFSSTTLLLTALLCLGLAFVYLSMYLQRRNPPSIYLACGFVSGALSYGVLAHPAVFGMRAPLIYHVATTLYFGGFSLFSVSLIERNAYRNILVPVLLIVAGVYAALAGHLDQTAGSVGEAFLEADLLMLLAIPSAILGYFGLRLHRGVRRKPVLLAVAVALLAATFLWQSASSPAEPADPPTAQSLGYLAATGLIYASISFSTPKATMLDLSRRHHIERMLMDYFANPPSPSSQGLSPSGAPLTPGTLYLVKEPRLGKSLERFLTALGAGIPGLMLSRTHPRTLRDAHPSLRSIPVLWVTDSRRGKDVAVSPQPEQVYAVVETFLEKTPEGVVLIDGVEYLINYNNFDIVLHLVEQIRDLLAAGDARVILSVHPGTLKRLELNLIERETVPLEG